MATQVSSFTRGGTMTKQELLGKIEAAGRVYGVFENVTIFENAYHACNPANNAEWRANGFLVDGNKLLQIEIKWDFSDVPGYKKNDDASSLPWEDENLMSIGSKVDNFDLDDENDVNRAGRQISCGLYQLAP